MAHNLNSANGKVSFMSTESAWHGLGQIVTRSKNVHEVAELANMNWIANKVQSINVAKLWNFLDTFANNATIEKKDLLKHIETIDSYGIYRSDNLEHIGEVGRCFKPCQFETAFSFVDALVNDIGGSHYETAGVLGKGEKFFLTVKLPWEIAPNRSPEDKTECYLLFTSANDGTGQVTIKLTTVRVVCQNTLNMALSSKGLGHIGIKHSSQLDTKLTEAQKLVSNVKATVESVQHKLSILAERKITPATEQKIFERLFDVKPNSEGILSLSTKASNNINEIRSLIDFNDNNVFPEVKGSAYNFLQGITEFTDHYRSVKETESVKGMDKNAIRYQSGIFGSGSLLKDKALEIILEETENAPPMEKILTSVSMPSSLDNILSNVAI